jgi:hypothetical protein
MANAATATYPGRGIIWMRMKGNNTEAKNIGWGASGAVTGSANANVNLFAPQTEARTAGTSNIISTNFLGDTYQVIGTITCAGAAKSITEVGLFDTTTLSPSSTLVASLSASATTMTLGANIGPSTGNYYSQLNNETILVTGANSTTLTIARGQLGSVAAIQAAASPVTIGGDGSAAGSASTWTTGQTATLTSANGGDMFIHADFGSIALNVNDSIAFTISDTLT